MDFILLIDRLEAVYKDFGYFLIFSVNIIESSPLGWLVPGGFIQAGGGFFAYDKTLSLFLVIISGFLGTWITPCTAYILGQKTGIKIAKKLRQEKRVERAKRIINKHGKIILTTTLLSNTTKFWISYAAGMQNYNIKKFLFYSGITSLMWASLWTTAGYLAGGERVSIEKMVARLQFVAWAILFLAIISIYISIKKDYQEFEDGEKDI
jgi:membrane protein DedA with SNARE-associated domain